MKLSSSNKPFCLSTSTYASPVSFDFLTNVNVYSDTSSLTGDFTIILTSVFSSSVLTVNVLVPVVVPNPSTVIFALLDVGVITS